MSNYDVVVIGGGAGGMAAALGAYENGAKKVLLLERDIELGGILQQCIHNGFGLHQFKEELTGPAYAERYKEKLKKTNIEIKLNSMVLKITQNKRVHYINSKEGYCVVNAQAIVLSTGCRERTQHAIQIPGKRLAGIMTAGMAQRYLNIEGYLVGKRVFILGSGDIGLIMARRMTLEGAKVLGVAEIMPYSNGLNRNIVQCLHDYNIPLFLSHTVTSVHGKDRLEEITISQVDENLHAIPGSDKVFNVDTLLLSVGLIPENSLLKKLGVSINPLTNGAIVDNHYQTSISGIFACGNSLHVHDLVDYVSNEGYAAGSYAARYIKGYKNNRIINLKVIKPIRYAIPNVITVDNDNKRDVVEIKYRVSKPIEKAKLVFKINNNVIKKVEKRNLLPAEMQIINFDKKLFFNNESSLLKMELEEV